MFQRAGFLVGGLLFAPEHHGDPALGRELDDHVRAFVGDPDIVVTVDFHHVGEGPSIEIMADLAQKFAVGAELEKLRRGGGIGRAGGVAARQDEDVALGIDRDAADLAEIEVVRQLQRIGQGVEVE